MELNVVQNTGFSSQFANNEELPKKPDRFGGRLPLTINLRIKLLLTGIVFPAFSVAAGLAGSSVTIQAPWQSGNLEPYVALFLQSYGFVWAWRQAVDRVLIEYQNLPATDPNCFVASAAAYGTPRFVNAEIIDVDSGEVLLNEQMQRLKFLELALQSLQPSVHRITRKLYNQIGPKLARRCKASQSLANASYFLLKPAEWLAEIVRLSAGVSKNRVRQIYRN